MSRTFVLIHGGFHGGWCWERTVPLLEATGCRALAPDLPGMGRDPTPRAQVTLASTADRVAAMVRTSPGPVILVGHSMGGLVIAEAAERVPDRVLGLVFVTAVLQGSGTPSMRFEDAPPMTPTEDGRSVACDPGVAMERFYNTTDPETARAAVARLQPQPVATMVPAPASAGNFTQLPRAYVECTQDRTIPLSLQRAMQAALPCDPVFTLETDHSPFLSAPRQMSECLVAAADRFAELSGGSHGAHSP